MKYTANVFYADGTSSTFESVDGSMCRTDYGVLAMLLSDGRIIAIAPGVWENVTLTPEEEED